MRPIIELYGSFNGLGFFRLVHVSTRVRGKQGKLCIVVSRLRFGKECECFKRAEKKLVEGWVVRH